MKKLAFVLGLVLVGLLMASCVPVEPKDMLPYCKEQYAQLLEQDPNFPHGYIGYCVASLQTGKNTAYQPLCNYEPVWQMIEDEMGVPITTRQECRDFFASLD